MRDPVLAPVHLISNVHADAPIAVHVRSTTFDRASTSTANSLSKVPA